MTPLLQVILGDLLSVASIILVIVIATKFIEKLRYDLLLIVSMFFCLAIPAFVIGNFGFEFSNVALKNIFLVALLESAMLFFVSIVALLLGAVVGDEPPESSKDKAAIVVLIIWLIAIIAFTISMGIKFGRQIREEYRNYDFEVTSSETAYDVSQMNDGKVYCYVHAENYKDSYYVVFYADGEEIKPINIPMNKMRIIVNEEETEKTTLVVIKERRVKVCLNDPSYVPEGTINYYYRLYIPKKEELDITVIESPNLAEFQHLSAS
ncbi:MAG: hypothetical protein IKR04_03820 [Clostridia bacterium]|nr:hypothetical protein [Clostridia bacterium]